MLTLKQLVCRLRNRYSHVPVRMSVNLVSSELSDASASLPRTVPCVGWGGDGSILPGGRGRLQGCSAVPEYGTPARGVPFPGQPWHGTRVTLTSLCDLVGSWVMDQRVNGGRGSDVRRREGAEGEVGVCVLAPTHTCTHPCTPSLSSCKGLSVSFSFAYQN